MESAKKAQVEIDMRQEQAVVGQASASLHSKVSLLAGGNLAYVAADAVVNASNCWLTTGKGVPIAPSVLISLTRYSQVSMVLSMLLPVTDCWTSVFS